MHLRKAFNKKTGRTYLSIVKSYRDAQKKTKSRTIQKIGYLDVLEKTCADPVAHFESLARQMTAEDHGGRGYEFSIGKDERLAPGESNRKNYGHVVLSQIYHELELDTLLKNKRRHENFSYNTDSILRLLVFSRLLYPASKKATFEMRGRYFDSFRFSDDDIYNSLDHFDKIALDVQKHLHEQITGRYGRKADLIYYDVTNYYFETDKSDGFRTKGYSKEHRPDPIVQMGLAVDERGIPIGYKLFAGNTNDQETLIPAIAEVKKRTGAKRAVVVADKGLNGGDNIAFNMLAGNGYVFSKSVRGASDDLKAFVLDQSGYIDFGDDYKRKSRVLPVTINVTSGMNGKKKAKTQVKDIDQKQVVFYSEKYAKRARALRAEIIAKARKLVANPKRYNKASSGSAADYVANIKFDKDGEILEGVREKLYLDEEKIKEQEQFDGYYAIITSELEESDERIIELYRGLWRIEECFKVTKSCLDARPVYVRLEPHINAHFLICFIALTVAKLIELRLGGRYPIPRILGTLRHVACSHLDQNHYLFDYADEITEAMNAEFGTDFGRKIMTLGEIKKSLGQAKKA
jgi:transposase